MGIKHKTNKVMFDSDAYGKAAVAELTKIYLQALDAWGKEIEKRIPLWSGKTRAAFANAGGQRGPLFAKLIRTPLPLSPLSPNAPDRRGQGDGLGSYKATIPIFTKSGSFKFDFEFTMSEEFNPYFPQNENADMRQFGFNLIHPTPWHSLPNATRAFNRVASAKNLQAALPKIEKFLKLVNANG